MYASALPYGDSNELTARGHADGEARGFDDRQLRLMSGGRSARRMIGARS